MVLEAFWGPLGFILGALGALCWSHEGSLGAPELLKSLGPLDPRAIVSILMVFFCFFFLLFSMSFFISSRSPPTIKNLDFVAAGV